MNKLSKLLILLILSCSVIFAVNAENYSPLNVVGEVYIPFSYPAEDGTNSTGFSVELLQKISDLARVKITDIKLDSWENALNSTLNNKDTIVLAMYRTPEREGSFQFIGPIAMDYSAIFLSPDSNISINSSEDIKKMKIGAISKDAGIDIIKSIGVPDSQIIIRQNLPALSSDLKNHTIDGFIYGEDAAIDFADKTQSTFTVGIRLKDEPIYFGLNKDTSVATASALKSGLEQIMMKKNGTESEYEVLAKKYRIHVVDANDTAEYSVTQTSVTQETVSVIPSAPPTTKKSPGILPITCITGLCAIAIFAVRNKR